MERAVLDDLDRALVHALQLDGRVPFGRVAAVLGVSDQTVARRYRRLRGAGVLRVVGLAQSRAMGYTEWFVRLRCLPDGALPIARALARRDEISWVMLTSAGTEITCRAQTRTRPERDALLLGALPRTRQVTDVDALCVLATFAGGATGWSGRTGALAAEQVAALAPRRPAPSPSGPVALDEADLAVLAALRRDARLPVTDLAGLLGCSVSAASRRLDRLLDTGTLAFDVEIAPEHLGYEVEALLWLTVVPGALERTAAAVTRHASVAFAAATSGPTNLLVAVGCRDVAELYDYLAHRIGPLPGVTAVHSAPVIATLKRAGTLLT